MITTNLWPICDEPFRPCDEIHPIPVARRNRCRKTTPRASFLVGANRICSAAVGKDLQIIPGRSWFVTLAGRLKCMRGKHEPLRDKVRRDGVIYRAHCDRCGIPIAKLNGRPWAAAPPRS